MSGISTYVDGDRDPVPALEGHIGKTITLKPNEITSPLESVVSSALQVPSLPKKTVTFTNKHFYLAVFLSFHSLTDGGGGSPSASWHQN